MTEPTPDTTSLSGSTWQELYGQDSKGRPGVMLEASRRVVTALEVSERSATNLGRRIERLNLWLVIFTIAICGLTLIPVLVEVGLMRRPHEQATGSAWVLWIEVSRLGLGASVIPLHVISGAQPTFQQCEVRRLAQAQWLLRVSDSERNAPDVARVTTEEHENVITKTTYLKDGRQHFLYSRLLCLPGTIDPREPKGK